MITHDELVAELMRMGLPNLDRRIRIGVPKASCRGLPAKEPVRVRASGVKPYWPDHQVVAQAEAACRLYDHFEKTDFVLLNLWWAGFPIDPGKAQQVWLSELERHRRMWDRAASSTKFGDVGDVISRQVSAASDAMKLDDANEAVEGILLDTVSAIYDPEFEPDYLAKTRENRIENLF